MSSIVDIDRSASPAAVPTNGRAGSRIVHFDATVRRKEKMRQRAAGEPDTAEAKTAAAAPSAPATPTPAVTAAAAAPPAAQRNGGFVHPAAAVPTPASVPQAHKNGAAKSNGAAALPSGAELEKFLVAFVVEQTGYPEEMVELDADLEADLGIDSIKKAQLFGELAERFQIDVQGAEELSLDDFPTLRHVKSFLDDAGSAAAPPAAAPSEKPDTPAPAPPPAEPAAAPTPAAEIKPVQQAAPARSAALPQGAELEKFLIAFVVEQTGYPEEMVELDADLEADLGIDSIKKAQLFGELAEQFQIDVKGAEDLSLDDFPTLRHVMSFLEGSSNVPAVAAAPEPVAAVPSAPPTPPAPQPAPALPAEPPAVAIAATSSLQDVDLEKFLIEFVVEQTGYPEEMVELDADLEADLGIDSIKKAQLFGELAEQFEVNVAAAEDLSLDDFPTLRHVMEFLEDVPQQATV